jgi:hypothetical protein
VASENGGGSENHANIKGLETLLQSQTSVSP